MSQCVIFKLSWIGVECACVCVCVCVCLCTLSIPACQRATRAQQLGAQLDNPSAKASVPGSVSSSGGRSAGELERGTHTAQCRLAFRPWESSRSILMYNTLFSTWNLLKRLVLRILFSFYPAQ